VSLEKKDRKRDVKEKEELSSATMNLSGMAMQNYFISRFSCFESLGKIQFFKF
jgi:hypothetical protein